MGDTLLAENFDIFTAKGLSVAEAERLLKDVGYNELPSYKPRTVLATAWEVVRQPMFLLLVAGGLVYLLLGDLQEALMLLGFVFVVMGITFYQERKTERALESLRDLSSPRALVIREGEDRRIAGRQVVPGDLMILSEGDRVAADAVLLSCTNLSADESLLTGESVPVRKVCCIGTEQLPVMARPGGDDLPFVFSGSLVVQGQGVAVVRATGINTEIGKIGRALQKVTSEETSLQKETNLLVRNLAILGLSLCLLVVIAYGMTRGDWLQGLLAGITMAMAYILAIHVPIAGLSLIPVLLEWPLIFFPIHVVFLELIIDPACSIAFEAEPEEADVMLQQPRNPTKPLFSRRTLGLSLLQGISVLIIVMAVFSVSLYRGQGEAEARALTYTTLIIANLGLILANRSWSRTIIETMSTPNPALWWVVGGAGAFLALVVYVPFIRELFGFANLHFIDIVICFMAGIASVLWFEGLKVINRRRDSSTK